jgi:hypothetical protein
MKLKALRLLQTKYSRTLANDFQKVIQVTHNLEKVAYISQNFCVVTPKWNMSPKTKLCNPSDIKVILFISIFNQNQNFNCITLKDENQDHIRVICRSDMKWRYSTANSLLSNYHSNDYFACTTKMNNLTGPITCTNNMTHLQITYINQWYIAFSLTGLLEIWLARLGWKRQGLVLWFLFFGSFCYTVALLLLVMSKDTLWI